MKNPQDSSIFICSIVRNAEKGLKRNIPVISEIFRYFRSVKVFVFENDSRDGSKELLSDWAAEFPDIVSVSLNDNLKIPMTGQSRPGVNPFFSRNRIEKMVFLRNKYLDYIAQSGWHGEYLMVVDLDVCRLSVSNIMSSFESETEWDAISAYGYSLSPKLKERYHDTYAYRPHAVPYDTPQTERDIYKCNDVLGDSNETDSLIPVTSAYGGLAIYRWKAVDGLRYELEMNEDPRVEVYCEHRSLYRQMYERGYRRFFINPRMRLKYQELTLPLMMQWIRKKFRLSGGG